METSIVIQCQPRIDEIVKRRLENPASLKRGSEKKRCKRPSTATEMGDSDVSLSDDDDDEVNKLSRGNLKYSSRIDGSVAVPGQSEVFLKIVEQKEKQNQIQKASAAASGRLHNSRAPSGADNLRSSVPLRAISKIELAQSNQTAPIQAAASMIKSSISRNSILNPTISQLKEAGKSSVNSHGNQKDLRLVGGVLLSNRSLALNSTISSTSSVIKVSNLRTGNAVLDRIHFADNRSAGVPIKKLLVEKENAVLLQRNTAKKAQSDEIEQLLGMKSSHAEERKDEWFEGFEARTEKLANKEELKKKLSTVVSTFVKAYHCKDCKLITESALAMQLCSNNNHDVLQIRGVKWFFECAVCQRRESTLSAAPSSSSTIGRSTGKGNPNDNKKKTNELPDTEFVSGMCSKQHPVRRCECGAHSWRSCSMYASNEGKSIKAEQRVILSASEWTSRQDLASLDSMRSSVL
jgi:Mcm10 replication factor